MNASEIYAAGKAQHYAAILSKMVAELPELVKAAADQLAGARQRLAQLLVDRVLGLPVNGTDVEKARQDLAKATEAQDDVILMEPIIRNLENEVQGYAHDERRATSDLKQREIRKQFNAELAKLVAEASRIPEDQRKPRANAVRVLAKRIGRVPEFKDAMVDIARSTNEDAWTQL